MKRILLALIALPISVFAEGGLPNQPYIYTEGTAEIQKPADIATLRFDVVARAPDQTKANEDVQAKSAKVFALLNSKKIGENDVIGGDLKSEPEFEQGEGYTRNRGKLVGYVVTRPFQVKVRDVASFPKLVDELIATANVEFSGIEGGLSNEKEMQDQIREKAMTDARQRAEKTLKPMGMKVESVFAVSTIPFPEISSQLFSTIERLGVRSANLKEASAETVPEYRLAPITINQTTHVIYLISPAK